MFGVSLCSIRCVRLSHIDYLPPDLRGVLAPRYLAASTMEGSASGLLSDAVISSAYDDSKDGNDNSTGGRRSERRLNPSSPMRRSTSRGLAPEPDEPKKSKKKKKKGTESEEEEMNELNVKPTKRVVWSPGFTIFFLLFVNL